MRCRIFEILYFYIGNVYFTIGIFAYFFISIKFFYKTHVAFRFVYVIFEMKENVCIDVRKI